MTPEQIQMLKRTINGVDLLSYNQEEKEMIAFLLSQEFCQKPASLNQTTIYASQRGKAYLHSQEEMIKQNAKNERQQRFENKISILSILIPLITFILGILVEHWIGFVDFFVSLF